MFKNLNERNISISFNEGSKLKLNISRVNLGVIIYINRLNENLLLKLTEKELFYEGYTWLIIIDEENYIKTWEAIRQLDIRIDTDMIIAIRTINAFDIQQIYKIRTKNHNSCVRYPIGYYTIDGLSIVSEFLNVEDRKNFNKLPYRVAQNNFKKTMVNIEELSYDTPAVNLIINLLITTFNAR